MNKNCAIIKTAGILTIIGGGELTVHIIPEEPPGHILKAACERAGITIEAMAYKIEADKLYLITKFFFKLILQLFH